MMLREYCPVLYSSTRDYYSMPMYASILYCDTMVLVTAAGLVINRYRTGEQGIVHIWPTNVETCIQADAYVLHKTQNKSSESGQFCEFVMLTCTTYSRTKPAPGFVKPDFLVRLNKVNLGQSFV